MTFEAIDAPRMRTRRAAPPLRRHLGRDLAILGVVILLVLVAGAAAAGSISREFCSPSAFVSRYLDLLAHGDAADALALPGVAPQQATGSTAASDALLRQAALGPLSEVRIVSEHSDGDAIQVTASYLLGTTAGSSTFRVTQDGSIGLAPRWRFAQSPLATLRLTVLGSLDFHVNGFAIDKRQVAPQGAQVPPMEALNLTVFTPGRYEVSVNTDITTAPAQAVNATEAGSVVPLSLQTQPTQNFIDVVQKRVDNFLTACTSQTVLQPSGCPFGFVVNNRVVGTPSWTIVSQLQVTLVPDNGSWQVPDTPGTAHITVQVRSLYDGSERTVSADVPFHLNASISTAPDRTITILIGGSSDD